MTRHADALDQSPQSAVALRRDPQAGMTMEIAVANCGNQRCASAMRFNQQLQRIDGIRQQIAALEALQLQVLQHAREVIKPLFTKRHALYLEIALFLDQRLEHDGQETLTASQRTIARNLICKASAALARSGHAAMERLHDKHSPQSLKQRQHAEESAMRAGIEAAFDLEANPDQSTEALMAAARARYAQARSSREARKSERRERAAEKLAQKGTGSAGQRAAQAALMDANSALRTIFRKLASALHPDRETDAAERTRKTALMSAANAAYGRRDLVALLQIQLNAELAAPDAVAQMADEKAEAFSLLLKQQVADLERERARHEQALRVQLDLPRGMRCVAPEVLRFLDAASDAQRQDISALEEIARRIRDDAALRRWLNARSRELEAARRDPAAHDQFVDLFTF